MLVGSLNDPKTHEMLASEEDVWMRVMRWVANHRASLPDDSEHMVEENFGIRAIVQRKGTKPWQELEFETHREHVDFQICIKGSEYIGWLPKSALANAIVQPYDLLKDVELYSSRGDTSRLAMTPGVFAIFYPDDAHMPLIRKDDEIVEKIVFKIPYKLLSTPRMKDLM